MITFSLVITAPLTPFRPTRVAGLLSRSERRGVLIERPLSISDNDPV